MLLEDDGLHVRLVHHHVNDAELGVRELLGHLVQSRSLREAHGDHDFRSLLGEAAQVLLTLGLLRDFRLAVADARFLAELLRAVPNALVEGLVELAAHVKDDRRLEGQRRNGQCGQQRCGQQGV